MNKIVNSRNKIYKSNLHRDRLQFLVVVVALIVVEVTIAILARNEVFLLADAKLETTLTPEKRLIRTNLV